MNRIFKKSKSKGKGSTAEAASVNSGDGTIQPQVGLADYNVKEKDLPKLHKAAWNGDVNKLRNLGGKKQDFNALDKANRTPLHLACFNGHVEVVKFLVGSKVKLNVCDSDQRSPLMRAVQCDHFDIAEFLLKRNADPSLIDVNGDAALHIAVYGSFLEMVKLLLDFGAMVDATNKQGSTPLHLATIQGSTEIVEVLLQNKADVNLQDNLSRTALMLACQADQIGIVKMLLEYKADPNVKDQKGWTANDHAIMGGFHGCSHLIEEQQTMKRSTAGSALSGTGLFGSTTNSVDALGFPLANPAATSDLSVDNEDDLSIDKKSDEDSWGASNSEFDDPVPRKSVPLLGGKKTPSIKSFPSDSSLKSKEPQITPRNSSRGLFGAKDKKRNNIDALPGLGITPRSEVSEVVEEEKPTPRGRTSSRNLISSGTISDWDDDSDILDDLSEKKGTALPIKIGSNMKMKKPQNGIASNIGSDQGGFNKDLSDVDEDTLSEEPKNSPVAAAPVPANKIPPKKVTEEEEKVNVMEEDSDSDWDSEADDILPSDNSVNGDVPRGYTPSGVINSRLTPGRAAVSPSDGRPNSQGTRNAGISDGNYGGSRETPVEEDEASEEEWSEEREEEEKTPRGNLQGSSSSVKAVRKVLNTDQAKKVEKHVVSLEGSSLESGYVPSETKPKSNQQIGMKDKGEIESSRKLLNEERNNVEREKKKLEEEKTRQEEVFEKKLREMQAEEDGRRDKDLQERKKVEEERKKMDEERRRMDEERRRMVAEGREQEEKLEKARKELEEINEKKSDEERKKLDEEKRRMEEDAREQQEKLEKAKKELEEINKKKRDEMEKEWDEKVRESIKETEMERKRLEDEKQKMQEELMAERHRLAEEKKQLEERMILQEEKEAEISDKLESKKNEEWQSVKGEKEKMEKEIKKQSEALNKEKQKMEEERRKEMDQLRQDRYRLEQEKTEVERVKKEAENLKQETNRIEEERVKLEKAARDVEKIAEEKKRLEEEREKLEEAKKEAEKIEEEKRMLEEKKRELEKAKEEAEMIEKERKNLQEERKQVEIAKKEKEKFDIEKKSLEEEKKQLEAVKKGETNYVEFEKQKLEREKQQLERSRKEEEEYIKLEKEKIEEERKRMEKIKMEAEEKANLQERKLETKKQQFEARMKEEEDKMRKMQTKIEELEEKSTQLEKANEEKIKRKHNSFTHSKENGVLDVDTGHEERKVDRAMVESNMRQALIEVKDEEHFKQEPLVGLTNGEVKQNARMVNGNISYGGDRLIGADDSESDSEVAELAFEKNTTLGFGGDEFAAVQPNQRQLDWHPHGLLGGAPPRNRKTPKKATVLNGSSSGRPAVHINNWQGLLDEYDGLDYSSSSVGEDGEDEVGLGNLSPVSASTPLIPGNTLPLSSSFHLSQTGATTQIQNLIQDLRYKLAKERQSARLAQNKVRQLEAEKDDILQKLDDCINEREMLRGHNLEIEKKLQVYDHEMDQEREQRQSAELLLKKIKAQLSKKDQQLSDEQQAREQAEMALCKLQVDLRITQNTVHQLEVERDEMQRHFTENENSLKYQQKLMETQHMKQDTMYEAGSVVLLEAADESRKAAWSQSEKLKEELFDMKVEMERLQFKYKGNEGALTNQIQDLESKVADLRQEQIINEDALHHASQAFHAQLTAVKIENGHLKTTIGQEQDKVTELNTKVDTLKKENEKLLEETQSVKRSREETERTSGNKIDKLTSLLEERRNEISHLKETVKGNEKTLESLHLKVSHLKEQLTLANTALLERTNQLNTFQREMDKKLLNEEGHNKVIHLEREEKAKLMNKYETLNERLSQAQEENTHLKREVDGLKTQIHQRDRDSEDAREKLNSTISAVQKEKDQVKSLWEEKQVTMADNLQTLKDTIGKSQSDFREKEAEVRALRQQLSEAEKKLALSEANMIVLQKTCDNKERETKDSQNELKQLQEKIMVSEMNKSRVESKMEDAQKSLEEMERRYKDSCIELTQAKKSLEQQEIDVRKLNELEREKAKLEIVVEQEKDRNESLKKELEHTLQMKNNLEVLLTELKNANLHIGEKLNMESAARNLMSQEVDDHKELWESELKSKSKLGLRLAQLQRARVGQQGQLEEEKRRSQKALEMKEQMDEKLEMEKERNHQLEQSVVLLRSKLKLAKRKLQDLQVPEAKIQSLQTEFERERFNFEAALATQRKQLENANEKLEKEYTARKKLEVKNNSLQLELKTAKSLEKKSSELYKSNKRLEAELADTKKSIQESYVEKGELDKYKQTMDTKLRHDMNERLAQINTYLDEQSLAREKIDQVQQDAEAEVRKELEKSISDLKNELTKLRTSNSDLTAKKETLEAELQRYKSLFKQESEKSQRLTDELEQCRRKVTELRTQVRIEQQRALQQRTETPTLDLSSQKFAPPKQQQLSKVDDITNSVREELNRSISRHMEGTSSDMDFQYRGHFDVNTDPGSPGSSYLAVLKKNYFV